jgi:hypothetical protein
MSKLPIGKNNRPWSNSDDRDFPDCETRTLALTLLCRDWLAVMSVRAILCCTYCIARPYCLYLLLALLCK